MFKLYLYLFLGLSVPVLASDDAKPISFTDLPSEMRLSIIDYLSHKEFVRLGLTCKTINAMPKESAYCSKEISKYNMAPPQDEAYSILNNTLLGMSHATRYLQARTEDERQDYFLRAIDRLGYPAGYLYQPALDMLMQLLQSSDPTEVCDVGHLPGFIKEYYEGTKYEKLLASSDPLSTEEYEYLIGHHRFVEGIAKAETADLYLNKLKKVTFIEQKDEKPHALIVDLHSLRVARINGNLDRQGYFKELRDKLNIIKRLKESEVYAYPLQVLNFILQVYGPEVVISHLPGMVKCFLKKSLLEKHQGPCDFFSSLDKHIDFSSKLSEMGWNDARNKEQVKEVSSLLGQPLGNFYQNFLKRGYLFLEYANDYLNDLDQQELSESNDLSTRLALSFLILKISSNMFNHSVPLINASYLPFEVALNSFHILLGFIDSNSDSKTLGPRLMNVVTSNFFALKTYAASLTLLSFEKEYFSKSRFDFYRHPDFALKVPLEIKGTNNLPEWQQLYNTAQTLEVLGKNKEALEILSKLIRENQPNEDDARALAIRISYCAYDPYKAIDEDKKILELIKGFKHPIYDPFAQDFLEVKSRHSDEARRLLTQFIPAEGWLEDNNSDNDEE